jgi:hypothetical protein
MRLLVAQYLISVNLDAPSRSGSGTNCEMASSNKLIQIGTLGLLSLS